jgi:glycopeptide antibiotics resistance protein
MKIRQDLILHFLINIIVMILLYKIPFSFGIVIGIGIIKEYGYCDWIYRIFQKDHKDEVKDVDDIAANFLGASIGYLISLCLY